MSVNIDRFLLHNSRPWTLDSRRNSVDSRLTTHDSERSTRNVAEEFASLLLLEMLKSMRATLSEEGLDGEKSSARDTYTSLADVEVTRSLVRHDTMGLTAFLERALSRAPSGMALKEMLGPTDVKI